MRILINGKEEILESEMNVLELLKKKDIRPEVVTVELNEKIIDRKDYQTSVIREGDRLEFVYFMGGGRSVIRNSFLRITNHELRTTNYESQEEGRLCKVKM